MPEVKWSDTIREEITDRISKVENNYAKMLREILSRGGFVPNEWERGFLQSISSTVSRGGDLSVKQVTRLAELHEKAMGSPESPPEQKQRTYSRRSRITAKALAEGMGAMDLWFKDPTVMTILRASAYEALIESLEVVPDRAGKPTPKIPVLDKWYLVRCEEHPTQDKRYRWLAVWIEAIS